MPTRLLKEGILTSDKVNNLSSAAELFYRRLMSIVDDYGRYDARVPILRASCYPLKLDSVGVDDIAIWIDECQKNDLLQIYKVDEKCYLQMKDFRQQVRSKKSKFPAPVDPECGECTTDAKHMHSTCTAGDKQVHSTCTSDAKHEQCMPRNDVNVEDLTKNAKHMHSTCTADAQHPCTIDEDEDGDEKKNIKKNFLTEIPKSKPFLPPEASRIDYSGHVQEWNKFAKQHGLPRVEKLTKSRKSKIKSRLAEGFDWRKVLPKISASSFLRGDNKRSWKVFFDWLFMNENNWLKVAEGHYDSAQKDNQYQLKSINPANYSEVF
ncbi:hypothetical protein P0136_05715 [Lentisphaerota bacterium ZTH]|nr:hypothetical protein JYG24_03175 [Lentisphaerota bacterium]WET07488.1 hypothetical protein P0136_05715 [Lentisphaerota bacterium ZTH]